MARENRSSSLRTLLVSSQVPIASPLGRLLERMALEFPLSFVTGLY